MSALTGKPFQPYTSALNTTASGGSTAYQFIQVPRNLRRSHTAERSYREMNPQETSFVYEKAPKNEALKEIVQSPYLNGRKNSSYVNPTYASSNFMNQSMELHRPNLAQRKTEAPKLQRSHSQVNTRSSADLQAANVNPLVTPREAEIIRKTEVTPRTGNLHTDVSPKFNNAAAEIRATEPTQATFGRRKSSVRGTDNYQRAEEAHNEKLIEAAIDRYLEVCNDCYNEDAAHENVDRRRKERQAEIELERVVMEYNNQLLRAEKEHQRQRREVVQNTSSSNFEAFKEKKARLASRERDVDEDVALKPHTKSLAAESLRSLQRYQSILDKMYDNSVRKIDERKGDLRKSQQHNRSQISRNEETRADAQQKHTLVNFKVNNDRSMLDQMHDNDSYNMSAQAMERRRASEYNHRTGAQRNSRHASPMELHEDPFKQSGLEYERNNEGRGMLDRLYTNSVENWKRQQHELREGSRANREHSAYLKNKRDQEEKEIIYSYRYAARNNVKSMLNSIYDSDANGLDRRNTGTRDCANFNKDNGYSQESALMKSKTLENYYNSPTKKVGDTSNLDYSQWTHEHSGVFSKINNAVDKLENDRRAQILENGSTVKQQMGESAYRRRDEATRDRQFKETPLLVCSHKANLMYCNICNRKVPMNKISKIIGDYKKFMKNKNSKCTL